jgi:hypothetical protein
MQQSRSIEKSKKSVCVDDCQYGPGRRSATGQARQGEGNAGTTNERKAGAMGLETRKWKIEKLKEKK